MDDLTVKITEEEFNNSVNNVNNLHYVGVMFEDKYNSSLENPKFYGKVYEYKTYKPLKEGEIITINTDYGSSRVCIVKDNILENDLQFKDINRIKEI